MKPHFLFVITALFSCHKITDSTERHYFNLIDNNDLEIGVMECELPIGFDTTYSWFDKCYDCFCSGTMAHRSHNKNFQILKESEGHPTEKLDSGFYLTINYLPNIECDTQSLPWFISESQAEIIKRNREFEIQNLYQGNFNGKSVKDVAIDTGRIINFHTYDIFTFKESLGEKPFIFLSARTKHHDRYVWVTLQSNVHTRETFIRIAKGILNSIRIK